MNTLSKQFCSLIIGLILSNTAFARFDSIIRERFERFNPHAESNSGHTVFEECGGTYDGNDYYHQRAATAKLKSLQVGSKTKVKIVLRNGRPDTLYTVWLRVKGTDQGGDAFGGNPLTNGGATPLAAGYMLDTLESISPWNSLGSSTLANGFTTNSRGKGRFSVWLDFPLRGGSYPFNKISSSALENIRDLQNPLATGIPTAIVDPRESNINAPFLIRIVSHCQDGLGHGLSPANRETWFDWPAR